jgi:glycosyltransferase involved in cell wall biosynthesis
VLNQPKFRQKWDAVLAEYPENDPAAVERVARRRQGARTIVMIDNYVPEPDRDSGSNKNAHIIRLLRELGWHVIFLPDNDHASQPYTRNLQQLGVEVVYHTSEGAPLKERVRRALALADAVWIGRPDVFGHFRELLAEYPDLPIVYDTHDLHFVRKARELELRGDATAVDRRKLQMMKEDELEVARTADVTLTITGIEREILEAEGLTNVRVLSNIHVPAGRGREFADRRGLVFIGGYAHTPNVDAVEWLVREIMPLVWKTLPGVSVTLLGSNPSDRVRALAKDNRVFVTGFVPDVSSYFESARVFVSPLRFGAGLKGKIGQSLEYALPVVTTSIGAEGFEFVDGRDALIADDAEGFAQAIVRLYDDGDLWGRLSDASAGRLAPYLPARVKERIAEVLSLAGRLRRERRQTAVA